MFKNHLKIAFRNLWNDRFFTGLNLIGLAVGIGVSLALMLYVKNELSFDKYHSNSENIYRVGLSANYDDVLENWANVPNITGPAAKENISAVREQARLYDHNFGKTAFVRVEDKTFTENNLYWADSSFLSIFDIPILEGNPEELLAEPKTILLSQKAAKKYFPYEDAVGKTLNIDNNYDVVVNGVFEDFPANSTFDCELIGSFVTQKWAVNNLYWSNASFETFLLLHPDATEEAVEKELMAVYEKAVAEEDRWFELWLQPFEEIHLYSEGITEGSIARLGSFQTVKILSILALAVLLLACFNYINMTTARSQKRFREVGINKTLGASTGNMIGRFYVETGVLAALAVLIGIIMVELSLPIFQMVSGKEMSLTDLFSSEWALAIPAVWLAVTLGAGFYPAFYLSNFSPKEMIQSSGSPKKGRQVFRHALVVAQFSVCIALIIGAVIFNRQLNFISQKNLGFKPEQVVAINGKAVKNLATVEGIMNELKTDPAVIEITKSQSYPGAETSGYSMSQPGQSDKYTGVHACRVSGDFEMVLGLEFLTGKSIKDKPKEDTTIQVVMNESGVKFLGWTPEEAIGKTPPGLFRFPTTIAGVVKDFHFQSLHAPITPYVFHNGNDMGWWQVYMLAKLNTQNLPETIKSIENIFKKHAAESAFEFTFLDDNLNQLYAAERRLSSVVLIFTLLTIFISCLGLFGLAAFAAEQRTKEIGIRKVLGASVTGIVGLLSKDFLKPVITAIFVAVPLAYYFMGEWLQNFAYSVNMEWSYFTFAALAAVGIALLTVSFQSARAALANPTESLRSE